MEVVESAKYFGNLGRFDAEKMKAHDCPTLRRNTAFYANATDAKRKFSEIPTYTNTRGLPGQLGYDLTEELRDIQIKEPLHTTFEDATRTNMLTERLCRCTDELQSYKFANIKKSTENSGKERTGNATKFIENGICLCPKESKATQNNHSTGNNRTLENVMPPLFKGQNNNDKLLIDKNPGASLPGKEDKDLLNSPAANASQELNELDTITTSLSRIENVQSRIRGEMNDIRKTLNKKVDKIEKNYKMITSDVRELGEMVELARFVNNRIERCSIRERLKKHFVDRNEVAISLEQENR